MTTSYFSITSNESVTPEKIGELLSEKFEGNARGICITEIPKATKQQPTVPVEFVVVSNMSDEEKELVTNALSGKKALFCGDTYEVEQIGAVLYVRGK